MQNQNTDPLIGREIDGYKIEKMLGEGGMARVYRAYDVNLHRYAAVKVIDPQQGNNPRYEDRFKQEARAVAQLRHANIVGIYRFGQVKGVYYMAMDYIEGSDLRWVLHDYHTEGELISHTATVDILSQIAKALDYAHSKGVIHRDIKPSNIMLDPKGDAILTDFGLAMITSEASKGEAFGSPHYIAPEQAIGSKGVVPQSDLYSLGVILYEMLTGSVPFNEGSAMQIAMAHITDSPPDPLKLNPNLHPAFIPLLEIALAKEPENRYQTGAKFAAALKNAVKQAKEDSGATRPATASSKPATRRKPETTPSSPPLRLSMIEIPAKVEKFRKANPLPAKPPSASEPDLAPAPVKKTVTAWKPISEIESATPVVRPQELEAAIQKNQRPRKKRSPLPLILLLVILLAAGVGAFVLTQSGGETVLPTTMVVEGRVTAINGSIVTIYDTPIVLEDAVTLAQIEVGAAVRIEGSFVYEDGVIHVEQVKNATIE